jgi:hypothetical protein
LATEPQSHRATEPQSRNVKEAFSTAQFSLFLCGSVAISSVSKVVVPIYPRQWLLTEKTGE